MGFVLTLRSALRALAKNKLRAWLTVLGVVIGIAAVTAMVSLGQSASAMVRGQFESIGTTVIGETTPIHRGRRTMVWQTRITTAEGKLVAVVTQTQMVL